MCNKVQKNNQMQPVLHPIDDDEPNTLVHSTSPRPTTIICRPRISGDIPDNDNNDNHFQIPQCINKEQQSYPRSQV